MSDVFGINEKKDKVKNLIRKLNEGVPLEEVKKEFEREIGEITPDQLSKVEEELIKDGVPVDELHRLCDVHIAMMRESLEKSRPKDLDISHPVRILMDEHEKLLGFAAELKKMIESGGMDRERLNALIGFFKESETHYLREENALFPLLEKHGITQPPAIMWTEHDKIRKLKKNLYMIAERKEYKISEELKITSIQLFELLSSHFYKENNILFPTALKVISEDEWNVIKRDFKEIGYCSFTPVSESMEAPEEVSAEKGIVDGWVELETGRFRIGELEAILNSLPVDITFVDASDEVRYFNQSKERVFARTKAVIGRKVQQCHPQKSIHVVNKIIDDFKNNRRESADFWIDMNGRLIYIRYFPVRDREGNYLGVIEVTQDITEIKNLKGEKRLLD